MTRICPLICNFLLFFVYLPSFAAAINNDTRVAFFYGDNPPLEELHSFNVTVVTPRQNLNPLQFNTANSELYAYVNVGELDPHMDYLSRTKESWRKGRNKAWGSYIMDVGESSGWPNFLLDEVISSLWQKGYRGFFLDTLDSYQLLKLSKEEVQKQQNGLVHFISGLRTRFPKAKIIVNRGFEILPQIHTRVDAIAAESLFSGWNASSKQYQLVSAQDRTWLLGELNKARNLYGLPAIVIDYAPATQREQARKIAREIANLGFIPWVSDSHLKTLGVGRIEIIPRKILLLYNPNAATAQSPGTSIAPFIYTAFPFEYMGFVPILQPVDETLQNITLTGRYAGIIAWFDTPVIKHNGLLESWLKKQISQGIPVVFMQNFGLKNNSTLLHSLGVNVGTSPLLVKKVSVLSKSKDIGFEIFPNAVPTEFTPVKSANSEVLLKLEAGGQQEDAIAITSWGGYVLNPYDIVVLPNEQSRWVINPFEFYKKALRLPQIPVPDITTVNGRRILTAHIDGDAFISRVPWRGNEYAGEVLFKEILQPYKIPTTVSVIQREFELIKQYPDLEKRLTEAARQIFSLPWVQIATHTYSHPLEWGHLTVGQNNTSALSYPSKNYFFNYKKEIAGSTQFINDNLAPADKKVSAIFWSGDANLKEEPLRLAAQQGLKNINGMAKVYLTGSNAIANLSPFGIFSGPYFQVFSPLANDFEYTRQWVRPLYSFQNIVKTFQLTDSPIRYKPLSIYYHFYSATDQAGLRALKRIYEWVMQQPSTPIHISEYINKVLDFNKLVIARNIMSDKPSWFIANNGSLREFRLPKQLGYPNLETSRNVLGFNTHNQNIYIHLGPLQETWLQLGTALPTKPYLVSANAEIGQWERINNQKIRFLFKGYVPLQFEFANMGNCHLQHNNVERKPTSNQKFFIKEISSGTFEILCNNR